MTTSETHNGPENLVRDGKATEDVSRRDLVMKLLGAAAGGVALNALAGCAAEQSAGEDDIANIGEAIGSDVATYVALRALPVPADGTTRFVLGRSVAGDDGRGLFTFFTYPASPPPPNDDDGTILKPTASTNGRWRRVYSGALNVKWFGAKGDGTGDDGVAITNAIAACTSDLSTSGGVIFFPRGTYNCTTVPTIPNGSNNITFQGAGQNHVSGFSLPTSKIVDARTTVTSVPFLTLVDTGTLTTSRGYTFKDLAFQFTNRQKTGASIQLGAPNLPNAPLGTAGISFINCHFSGLDPNQNPPVGSYLFYHYAFEGVLYDSCTFYGDYQQLVFAGSGSGGPLTVRNCWFYDSVGEHIACVSNGDHDYCFEGCAFDPLVRPSRPAIGIDLRANGFVVKTCSFKGDVTKTPTVYLQAMGAGLIEGCNFTTPNEAIRVLSCNASLTSNVIQANTGINIMGGAVTTRANQLNSYNDATTPKRAIVINEPYSSSVVVDLGPDYFFHADVSHRWTESIHVGGVKSVGNPIDQFEFTTGTVHYDPAWDYSLNGPSLNSLIVLDRIKRDSLSVTPLSTLTHKQSGAVVTDEGQVTGVVTYILPSCQVGLEYTFMKRPRSGGSCGSMVIQAAAGDAILSLGSAGGVSSISNASTTEYNAFITLVGRYFRDTTTNTDIVQWRVKAISGTWS